MLTEIRKINDESVALAKSILLSGGLVAIPTETVYGLAAVGTNPEAVKKIFEVKGRPTDNPLIAHVHENYDIEKLVEIERDYVYELKKRFTPGPLTMVMKSRGVVCRDAVCGGDTLAVRIPSHEGCRKLLRAVDVPLVAPSANISKHTSPVRAEHVYNDLNGKIPLILDGGKCRGGIESTVIDATGEFPRILRAGLITKEMIESVAGKCEIAEHRAGDKVKSPGVKYSHYRPKCDTALFSEDETDKALSLYKEKIAEGKTPYIMCADGVAEKFKGLNLLPLGNTETEIAASLYDKLLEGEKKADIIIAVAMPDEKGINLGIMNRLNKSCKRL
ncbi:MAG: threonylcarbamoyl-AMP synthase [Clostridia bacterium]|nr:threonylcarbamoyl-AMP synthase [Clostridia bacterium]